MDELSSRLAGFLLAVAAFLCARLVRAALVAGVTGVAGLSAALGAPIRRGFDHLCAHLPRADPREWVVAIFQLALLVVCVLTACANYAVVRDTIRVVWPTEISPGPLALGIVLLTGALGYLLHRAESSRARGAILFVLAALTLVQADLAFERAKQIAEIDDLLRAATGGSAPAGNIVLRGETSEDLPAALREVLPPDVGRFFSVPLLSALIAGLLCLAEGLATWGVATYSRGEIVWYFCAPLLFLMLGILTGTDFIAGTRKPLTEAIEAVMGALIALRGDILGFFRPFIPTTQEWFARRDRQLQREHELGRIADEKAAESSARRHNIEMEEARRRSEREEREHEEAKHQMARQAELAKHAAQLELPILFSVPTRGYKAAAGLDGPVKKHPPGQQDRRTS